jgi:Flp pilus assembly secretin CpaC
VVRARNGGHGPDHAAAALNGFPGLMDLPVLGTLFRTRDFMHEKTASSMEVPKAPDITEGPPISLKIPARDVGGSNRLR